MPGRLEFEVGFRSHEAQPTRRSEGPLRILVLGDFGAGADRSPLEQRAPLSVDVDEVDRAVRLCAPRLEISFPDGGPAELLALSELADLHPDRLCQRLEPLEALLQTRAQMARAMPRSQAPPPPGAGDAAQEEVGQTLDRLLGKPTGSAAEATRSAAAHGAALQKFLRRAVEPHVVPARAREQEGLVAAVDQALAEQLRAVLHQPEFQALEASWRGLDWLVRGLELDEDLTLHMLDVTKPELAADVAAAADDLERSVLHRILVQPGRVAGGAPWALWVGLYGFGAGADDAKLLGGLGALGARAGAPFLAGADPTLLGLEAAADTAASEWRKSEPARDAVWGSLCKSAAARWVGLAFPRLLLRQPYGKRSDPIETFGFEELVSAEDPERFLWGNPALACAWLLGASFQQRGWGMQPGDVLQIDDLPTYSYTRRGESRLQPCTEALLSEDAAAAILARGVMPLCSFANRNAARLARFQSVADGPAPLAGPWG